MDSVLKRLFPQHLKIRKQQISLPIRVLQGSITVRTSFGRCHRAQSTLESTPPPTPAPPPHPTVQIA